MSGNVPVAQATSDEAVLPERVQEAVGQLMVAIADLAWLKTGPRRCQARAEREVRTFVWRHRSRR